jgi:hypothetical protein
VLVAAALLLGACSLGDDDDDAGDTTDDSGCPVEPGRVSELLGYEVTVDSDTDSAASCRYEPVDDDAHPGSHVLVIKQPLAEDGYTAAFESVEEAAGPAEELPEGAVDGAERGWVARLGRVVQIGAAGDGQLVQITVADDSLDVVDAEEIAMALVEDAIE